MAPSTPIKQAKRHEWSTIKRVRFFDALKSKKKEPGDRYNCKTARDWYPSFYSAIMAKAVRRKRRRSTQDHQKSSSILGRKAKVSAADLDRLTDQLNPEHEIHCKDQAELLPEQPSELLLP